MQPDGIVMPFWLIKEVGGDAFSVFNFLMLEETGKP